MSIPQLPLSCWMVCAVYDPNIHFILNVPGKQLQVSLNFYISPADLVFISSFRAHTRVPADSGENTQQVEKDSQLEGTDLFLICNQRSEAKTSCIVQTLTDD